jgi:hypothetical protein
LWPVDEAADRQGATMANLYRAVGAELSPYSVKDCAYSRDKAMPYQWVLPGNAISIQRPQNYHKAALGPIVEGAGCLVGLPA